MLASLVCEEIFSLMKLRLDNYFNLQKAGYMNMLSRVQVWSCSKRGWLLRLDFQQPSIPFFDPFSTQGLSLHFFRWTTSSRRNGVFCGTAGIQHYATVLVINMIAVNIILLFWLLPLSLLLHITTIFLYCEWFLLRLLILLLHFVPDRSSTSTTSTRVGLLGFSLDHHQRPDLDRFGSMSRLFFSSCKNCQQNHFADSF